MSYDEDIRLVRKDIIIDVSHLLWEIPTKLKITSDGKYYINNAHGAQLEQVGQEYICKFLDEELFLAKEHVKYLEAIQEMVE